MEGMEATILKVSVTMIDISIMVKCKINLFLHRFKLKPFIYEVQQKQIIYNVDL